MRHVLVETNWVYSYAAPAHHKRLDAVDLLRRARVGDIRLHLPALCLMEARQPLLRNCQPRHEADAVRQFLSRARAEQTVSAEQERTTREVLDRFEHQVNVELAQLDETIRSLRHESALEVFPLNEAMLARTLDLAVVDVALRPFDQTILAAILVRAEELRTSGESDICFCEIDKDLQPWDRQGDAKQPLTRLYDAAAVWVYGDFNLRKPERPENWPD